MDPRRWWLLAVAVPAYWVAGLLGWGAMSTVPGGSSQAPPPSSVAQAKSATQLPPALNTIEGVDEFGIHWAGIAQGTDGAQGDHVAGHEDGIEVGAGRQCAGRSA